MNRFDLAMEMEAPSAGYGLCPDLAAVEHAAHTLELAIREVDKDELLHQLAPLMRTRPAWMAQVCMVLAAWSDPYEPRSHREMRIDNLARFKAMSELGGGL